MTADCKNQLFSWRIYALMAILFVFFIFSAFYQTTWSIVSIWWRSETFAHGFLIIPITIWLIWDRRKALKEIQPVPELKALLVLFSLGFLWLLGNLVDALVIEQLALVGMLIAGIWAILGNQVSWAMAFPLVFLFFAVPMGEGLVPFLMEITATSTVEMIKMTGIPVYREGLFFSLPSGDWSVIDQCSGVRYLIASVTLGCLYAYLTYKSMGKRIVFIVVAAIVPIIANSVRAFIIVILGHLSDMKLATGVDHLIYGWFFFGIVMLILFSIGAIWRDPDESKTLTKKQSHKGKPQDAKRWIGPVKIGTLAGIVSVIWPLLAYSMDSYQSIVAQELLVAPSGSGGWIQKNERIWDWEPSIHGVDGSFQQFYENEGIFVSSYVGQYLSQKQGKELINDQNVLVSKEDASWRSKGESKTKVRLNGEWMRVDETYISGSGRVLLVWKWYRLGNRNTANPYIAKLFEAIGRLSFGRQDAALVVVATPINESKETAEQHLQQFLDAMILKLEESIDRVVVGKAL